MRQLLLYAALCTFTCAAHAADPALKLTFDAKGLASIKQGRHILMDAADGRVKVMYFRTPNPQAKHGYDQNYAPKPRTAKFDAKTKTLTQTYAEAELKVTWKQPTPDRLVWNVRLTNKGAKPLAGKVLLGGFRLTRSHHALKLGRGIGTGSVYPYPGGVIAFLNPPAQKTPGFHMNRITRKPVKAPDGSGSAIGEFAAETGFGRIAKHPFVDNKWFNTEGNALAPGRTSVWSFSILVGPDRKAIEPKLAKLRSGTTKSDPMVLTWDDRRPVGTIFWCHPNQKWKTNPRGFNFGKGKNNDVFTEEGKKVFAEQLFQYVDRCIKIANDMNAQGVIIWDLEGEEFWHPISYIGDPRVLPQAAPEMDALADAVFKRFRDAGLKTGVTIRPTEVFQKQTKDGGKIWWHRDVKDPAKLMADKIAYARKRWGTEIYYLDSNVFGKGWGTVLPKGHNVPWVMPTKMLAAVQQQHQDVLIIPEWSRSGDYRYGAPYSSPNNRQMCTPPGIRQQWPKAFRVVAVRPQIMRDHWSNYLEGVKGGDILLFPCWYAALENKFVKAVYQEAALAKARPAKAVYAVHDDLPALLDHDDEAVRYHVVQRLGRHDTAATTTALIKATEDKSILVRRLALAQLASRSLNDPALVERLVAVVETDTRDVKEILRPFAADVLGASGEAAVPALIEMLNGKSRLAPSYAVRALARTSTRNATAIKALLAKLGDKWDRSNQLQEPIIKALGRLKAKAAVPVLIELLKTKERNSEFVRLAAVRALGQIGDKRAINPLINHTKAHYSTVAVYSIHHVLDDALSRLTGAKGIVGGNEWRRWQKAETR